MDHVLPSDDYEELVRSIMSRLAGVDSVGTDLLDRPTERFRGASGTTHQIDVRWDLSDKHGNSWRLLFEARSYRKNLEQSAVFAFDGVVSDIAAISDRPCLGVMITTTGFQRGAKLVGKSRNVLLLELRTPLDKDFKDRLSTINVTATARIPIIEDVQIKLVDNPDEAELAGRIEILKPDGSTARIEEVLLQGELSELDEPRTELHNVHRLFEPNHWLICNGETIGELKELSATVGESATATDWRIGGREQISWVLKNAISDARVWFADNERIWSTD